MVRTTAEAARQGKQRDRINKKKKNEKNMKERELKKTKRYEEVYIRKLEGLEL